MLSHRLHIENRQVAVELPEFVANRGDHTKWLTRSSYDKIQTQSVPAFVVLQICIDKQSPFFAQAQVFAILNHADDLNPRAFRSEKTEAFTDRRGALPDAPRKGLVHDGHAPFSFIIGLREIASLQQASAQALEKAGTGGTPQRRWRNRAAL